MKLISPAVLHEWLTTGSPCQLIDVREDYEVDSGALPSLHIPMAEIGSRISELEQQGPVVIYCRSGKRAKAVAHLIESRFGLKHVHCLEGGIEAYVQHTEVEIEVY